MSRKRSIVVVGASLAGVAAIEELRERGFDGELVLVGAEDELPYDRPPLSKTFLAGEASSADCRLRPTDWADTYDVRIQLGVAASALDPTARTVTLSDGSALSFDGLVVATGAHARQLPGDHPPGVHTLRTLEDAVAIRDGLASASSLAVVGGGFIGAEVAATARGLGVDVTLIETLPTPLSRVLGTTIGDVCGRLHADHGVILRCGVPVTSIEGGDANVELLRLADGSQVAADLVVVGLGVTPNTDWLAGSGLKLGDGALCDQYCRTAAPHIVAAGDVARWDHPSLGSVRIEHWQNAVTQGRAAAASLLDPGLDVPFDPVPYVWSDQYDVTIQVAGRPEPGDDVTLVDTAADQYRFSALYSRDGRLTAGVSFGRQAATRRITRLLQERASVASAIAELREPNQIARSHDPGELPTATAA